MYSARDDIRLRMPGYPIRKSPDQSLLGGSPKLIAASHVLHRLPAPRHPPCALSSLTTKGHESHIKAHFRPHLKIPYYSVVKDRIALPSHYCDGPGAKTQTARIPTRARLLFAGGADRDRTGNPRLAKPMLSQLSYRPGSA
jgi:hypothetical protein